ncbi:putative metal-dependent hydrolase [Aquimarina sp. AD1]|uniref:YfiT family bacillithiol transferase n=1 Tax=Aquimarina sp. (strain AD1) TaxID=1714848 RepID=UPI000E5326CD|nr:putative metal-dependent hydrolase [Aquimarina sp. AD1]AXT58485.1 putative metal-dependent hydrolase [Aquimarina sp. AD1]RKN37590.1 putative metal-dependent hydrolase [Aquimarina sp. AD1]
MNLQYPIGKFKSPNTITKEQITTWIKDIEELPKKIEKLVSNFSEAQLETPYRPDGWTARQVIHHIHDSHHNGYIRFKWALTEEQPVIKAYYEDRWAELFDTKSAPIHLSLDLIKALHAKWVYFLKGLSDEDLGKVFIHPEGDVAISLAEDIGIYAWHGNHHLAHLQIIAGTFK